jgi:hypothetical protein
MSSESLVSEIGVELESGDEEDDDDEDVEGKITTRD